MGTIFIRNCSKNNEILIVGDINFHLDNKHDPDTKHFISCLQSFGLRQHVNTATHKHGHTLDVVITRDSSNLVSELTVSDPHLCNDGGKITRDHLAVEFKLNITKPARVRKLVEYRKLRCVNVESFKRDIKSSFELNQSHKSIDSLVHSYNTHLSQLREKHAPLITKTITLHPHAPWFNQEMHEAKHARRVLEKKYKQSGLQIDRLIFNDHCIRMRKISASTKQLFYKDKLESCKNERGNMFTIANELLGKKREHTYPDDLSDSEISTKFSNFFVDKIKRIRSDLDNASDITCSEFSNNVTVQSSLSTFASVSSEEMRLIIKQLPNKSSSLDPIPTWLLKECVEELLPIITTFVNRSMQEGTVPKALKHALVTPILKKDNMDPNILSNFRPVSNLACLAKILEKAVNSRLDGYLTANKLYDPLQSAYRKLCSTETALVKVKNDIMVHLDQGNRVALLLLDMSAAFDTLDHSTLLNRFNEEFGIIGKPLKWFESYFGERTQSVVIRGVKSEPVPLSQGVPQGSVIGPKAYTMYTKSLGDIIEHHGLQYHIYADDIQIYMPLSHPCDIERLELCLKDLYAWLTTNKLKLNSSKTELLQITPLNNPPVDLSLTVNGNIIKCSDKVKDLGVFLDSKLTMVDNIQSVTRKAYCALANIGKIRRNLTKPAAETLVNACVTSVMDYANSTSLGVPQVHTNSLQRLQNMAARIICRCGPRDHVTPLRKELHWLPIEARPVFKILCYTYKAMQGNLPEYMCDMVSVYNPKRCGLRSGNSSIKRLCTVKANSAKYGNMCYSIAAPSLWNKLPENIRSAETFATFKKSLKTFIFKKYLC